MTCDAQSLETAAAGFERLSDHDLLVVQTYLLAQIAGGSTDPRTLLASAVKFEACSEQDLMAIQTYLLCTATGGV